MPGLFPRNVVRLVLALLLLALALASWPAHAQVNFDRPGADYLRAEMATGDPADCAIACERDRRCRAWSFIYPRDPANGALCWLKNAVPPRVSNACCVSGVRGAGVVEPLDAGAESATDRFGGDYKNFDLERGQGEDACRAACADDDKCRAWTYARPGYVGREARCFLKQDIKPPRRKAGFTSGVVR